MPACSPYAVLGTYDDALRTRVEEYQAGLSDLVKDKDAKLQGELGAES